MGREECTHLLIPRLCLHALFIDQFSSDKNKCVSYALLGSAPGEFYRWHTNNAVMCDREMDHANLIWRGLPFFLHPRHVNSGSGGSRKYTNGLLGIS